MSHEEAKQGPNSIVEPGTKKRKIVDAKGRLPRSYAFSSQSFCRWLFILL